MIWYSLGKTGGKKYVTQLRIRPRTMSPLSFLQQMDAFLLRGLRTIQKGLHNNSWAKLYQRKKQKALTDDAASISAARLALF